MKEMIAHRLHPLFVAVHEDVGRMKRAITSKSSFQGRSGREGGKDEKGDTGEIVLPRRVWKRGLEG